MTKKGWFLHSVEHALARKGIKTKSQKVWEVLDLSYPRISGVYPKNAIKYFRTKAEAKRYRNKKNADRILLGREEKKGTKKLKTVILRGKNAYGFDEGTFYLDEKLNEIRRTDNPHVSYPINEFEKKFLLDLAEKQRARKLMKLSELKMAHIPLPKWGD